MEFEDRKEYLIEEAEIAIEEGCSKEEVEQTLIEAGFSPIVARKVVLAKSSKVRDEARKFGIVRLFAGLGLILLGAVLARLGYLMMPSKSGIRLLITGGVAGTAGGFLFLLAVWNVISGRESHPLLADEIPEGEIDLSK